jgi:hypothetical protein
MVNRRRELVTLGGGSAFDAYLEVGTSGAGDRTAAS